MAKASDLIGGGGPLATQLVDIAENSISSGSVTTPNVDVWLVDPANNPNGLELIELVAEEASGSSSRFVRMVVAQIIGTPINTFQQNSGEPQMKFGGLWLPAGYGIYCRAYLSSSASATFSYTGVFR